MLRDVLRMVEMVGGPISLAEMSRELGVDAPALEGMLAYWVQKGRLQLDERTGAACAMKSGGEGAGGCGCGTCNGVSDCPFMARMPRSYSFIPLESRG